MYGIEKLGLTAMEQEIAEAALSDIEDYEYMEVSARLFYHDTKHTFGVIERALKIIEAMGLPAHERLLAIIAAAYHDCVQDWEESGEGPVIRKRAVGFNEFASALDAVRKMDEINAVEQTFSPIDVGIVSSAIIATIPKWDQKAGTVIQPFLNPHSHPVVRTVALADIGSPGMDPEGFLKDGWNLFAEEQIDIIEALSGAASSNEISDEMQHAWRERLVTWLKSQAVFARGRRILFENEISGTDIGSAEKERLCKLFCHFNVSIMGAEENVRWAEQADFVPLMRKLLPGVFPDDQ